MIKIMMNGERVSATRMAAIVDLQIDGVMKHFRILRDAGLVAAHYDEKDNRVLLYYIPVTLRTTPGNLDCGFALIKLTEL